MFRIVEKRLLAPDIWLMNVEAPRVAKAAQPGQFVIVRGTDDGERIPLTVADYDREQGTISIVIQAVGASTRKIVALEEGGAHAAAAGSMFVYWGPLKAVLINAPAEDELYRLGIYRDDQA